MTQESHRQLAQKIIDKEKWWDILSRFIDVLRINIFIVDTQGFILLPPEEGRYGGRLLTDKSLGFDLLNHPEKVLSQFKQQGKYLESLNRFDLHSFALPIQIPIKNQTIAYMIVGPIILNKRLENKEIEKIAEQFKINGTSLLNEINEIRVVSNIMMSSILDLLSEIIRDNVELSLKKQPQESTTDSKDLIAQEIKKMAQEIYSTVRIDELLVTFLDVALNMTNTECGSIMILDENQKDMSIKVSRGIDESLVQSTKIKFGEGLSGLAAKENIHYLIKGQSGQNRIEHLLKRPEIKESLVMPLASKNKVIGVLNLHSKNKDSKIEDNVENIRYLSKLITSVF